MCSDKSRISRGITRRDVFKATGVIAATTVTNTLASASASASAAEMSINKNEGMTCGQYVLGRLKDLGVKHTFGVPGDFVYDVCDAIQDDPDIKGIWCANELNAGYAADGYARTNGVGVCVLTMGAELSAFQSLATANAEHSKIVQITGIPSDAERASGARLHHMIDGMQAGRQDLWAEMVKPITAGGDGGSIITPENCVYETERLIAAMLYHSKPISIVFPRLTAALPVVWPQGKLNIPLASPQSDPQALDSAVREILYRLEKANKAVWLPGYVTRRFDCVAESQALIEASGLPFCTGFQDKAVISEQHPQFVGVYLGGWKGMADPKVTKFVESCDCWVGIGPENHTFNNGFHTMQYTLEDTVNIMPHETRVGSVMYKNVEMKDILIELASNIKKRTDVKGPAYNGFLAKDFTGNAGDDVSYDTLYQRFQAFLQPNDILVGATSVASLCGTTVMEMPDGVEMEAQGSFGMLGWDTAAALGNGAAAPDRRCVILAGEGGHQMTANELGTYARYGIKPIFVVVNNGGYLAERVTNRYPDEDYNDLAQWDYSELPRVLGCKDWFTAKATTVGELDAALAEASKSTTGVYIEVVVDKNLLPAGADFLYGATGAYWGMAGRTWEQWLEEGRSIKRS